MDLRDVHEWATGVSIEGEGEHRFLSWHGGHHHANRIDGPLTVVGDTLHVPTADLGLVMVRPPPSTPDPR